MSRRGALCTAAFALALLLCACATETMEVVPAADRELASPDSPLRDGTLLGTPGPSAANDVLQRDAVALIGRAETLKGRSANVKIREVRSWPTDGPSVREIWVLDDPTSAKRVAYVITFTPAPGGTEIDLKGPFE